MSKPHLTIGKVSRMTCPYCGAAFERAVKASHRSMGPGSNALCGECGEYCVVGSDLKLRKPTQEELSKVNLRALQIGRQLWRDAKLAEAVLKSKT
jgi:hypothetical protein